MFISAKVNSKARRHGRSRKSAKSIQEKACTCLPCLKHSAKPASASLASRRILHQRKSDFLGVKISGMMTKYFYNGLVRDLYKQIPNKRRKIASTIDLLFKLHLVMSEAKAKRVIRHLYQRRKFWFSASMFGENRSVDFPLFFQAEMDKKTYSLEFVYFCLIPAVRERAYQQQKLSEIASREAKDRLRLEAIEEFAIAETLKREGKFMPGKTGFFLVPPKEELDHSEDINSAMLNVQHTSHEVLPSGVHKVLEFKEGYTPKRKEFYKNTCIYCLCFSDDPPEAKLYFSSPDIIEDYF